MKTCFVISIDSSKIDDNIDKGHEILLAVLNEMRSSCTLINETKARSYNCFKVTSTSALVSKPYFIGLQYKYLFSQCLVQDANPYAMKAFKLFQTILVL